MKWFISSKVLDKGFLPLVEKTSGERVTQCYQCGMCSASCPIAYEMDYVPTQTMRMIQLGMVDVVLRSEAIWLCASCTTCTTRCPRQIDIAEIMDALRRIAQREKIVTADKTVPLFNKIFIRNIEIFGRLFEAGLIGAFNILSGQFFKDIFKAPLMFLLGKIKPVPQKVKNLPEVRDIFKKAKKFEGNSRL